MNTPALLTATVVGFLAAYLLGRRVRSWEIASGGGRVYRVMNRMHIASLRVDDPTPQQRGDKTAVASLIILVLLSVIALTSFAAGAQAAGADPFEDTSYLLNAMVGWLLGTTIALRITHLRS